MTNTGWGLFIFHRQDEISLYWSFIAKILILIILFYKFISFSKLGEKFVKIKNRKIMP